MIRIGYLIDTIACDTEGTQKQLLETIKRLDRRFFQPHLICLRTSDWMLSNKLPCPYSVLEYKGFIKFGFIGVLKRLKKLISKNKIDIMQTFFEDPIFVAFCGEVLSRSYPLLLSSRRDMGLGIENQPWYHSIFSVLKPFVNRRFSGIIANCDQVRQYVIDTEKTAIDKIKIIRNGVEIPKKSKKSPQIFNLHEADIWIGMVASLTPVKRHDILLHALVKIKSVLPALKIKVLFLGEGQERFKLEFMAKQLRVDDSICFIGAVPDVDSFLWDIDIGVLCSDREGLSNAVLEYMACGLPIVATAVGGNIEIVSDKNGICVPPGNAEKLADALVKLIENKPLRKKLGEASLSIIRQSYSWNRTMYDLESYYKSILRA